MDNNSALGVMSELNISDDEFDIKRKEEKQIRKDGYEQMHVNTEHIDKSYKIQEKRKLERANYRKNKSKLYKQFKDEGLFKNKKEKGLHDHKLQELSMQSKRVVLIDLGYNSLMNYNELLSLACQVGRAYGQNKSRKNLLCYHLFGCTDEIMHYFEKMGASHWKVHIHKENLSQFLEDSEFTEKEIVKAKENILYFSPDSPNELGVLDEEFIIVLGGLVDKTIKKNQSLNQAEQLGLKSVRLPFSIYPTNMEQDDSNLFQSKKLNENQPLNIDNVINIIHDYLELKSWSLAFHNNISKRIKGKLIN